MLSKNWNWAEAIPARGKRMAKEELFIAASMTASCKVFSYVSITCVLVCEVTRYFTRTTM